MKLNKRIFIAPLCAAALALSACSSSDDDSLPADEESVVATDTDVDSDSDGDAGADADTASDNDGDADADADTASDSDGDAGADADGDNTDADSSAGLSSAIVNTVDVGFTSAVVDIVDTSAPFTSEGPFNPGVSDTIVRAFEDTYFVIRRFMSDSITAYNIADPTTPLYEFSTNSDAEEGVSSNPHDLIFLNSEKAYLLRYGSPIMWVVNPTATTIEEFMISEIDLSAFDADGVPEATRGVIVGNNLYIIMQRLEAFTPTQPGFVAVVDTTTDTIIDPGTNDSLPGIELPAFNPADVSVDTSTGTIFISAFGDFGAFDGSRPPAFTGGVVALDTADFSATQLIDDNDGTGRILNVEVTSASRGYIVTGEGFVSTSLDQFNPVTGQIEALGIAGLSDVDIRDLAIGPEGNLWVAVADAVSPRVVVINPADNSVVSDGIPTTQNPTNLAFTQ